MSTKAALELLAGLRPEEARRVSSLTVEPDGTVHLELRRGEPVQEGFVREAEAEAEEEEYALLREMNADAFVDLLTILDLNGRRKMRFQPHTASLWLGVDADELAEFVGMELHHEALGLWRESLTAGEQHRLRVALQNIVNVSPKGLIARSVKYLCASDEVSPDMRRHIMTRHRLGQCVLATITAVQSEVCRN